ncbi:hypothetical protein LSAT2_015608 [Lamellibrachia satsuma]|nr:hypothetical protein LSAT2_015608 [Lamellibrachia satsuma]
MTPPILPLPASPESATTSPVDDNKRTETVPSQEYHRSMPRRSKSKRRKHMAGALGLTSSDLTQDVVMARKHNIHIKLRQGGILRFTMEEEFDIHSRAEAYSAGINPEPSYYMIPSEKENISASNYTDFVPSVRKRRKHLAIIDNFILISPLGRYCPEYDNIVTLPNGVKLLRPPTKLVELVAEAINDSPDGMLQVQQVYLALQ